MANILSADLPSEDEEDPDFDLATEGPAAAAPKAARDAGNVRGAKLSRQAGSGGARQEELGTPSDSPQARAANPAVSSAWEALKATHAANRGGKATSLAAFCKTVVKRKAPDADRWIRELGLKSKRPADPANGKVEENHESLQGREKSPECVGVPTSAPSTTASANPDFGAAAALAAAKASKAASAGPGEIRRFAGKDVLIPTAPAAVKADQKARNKAGLDAVLASLQAAKKVSVLDKSRHDWAGFKKGNEEVDEELEAYKKSGAKFLDKVDFLQRSELRQYEQERDARLAADMRNRARS